MIIFFDKRTGDIFGTVDGRVHNEQFAENAMMGSSNIPEDQVGKFVVPTKPIQELVKTPIKTQFADPDDNFIIKEVITGYSEELVTRELAYDVAFIEKLLLHEDPIDPLQLIKCKVLLDESDQIVDIVEK